MHEPVEIRISENYLEKVFKLIKGNICLLGGWAAHHIINKKSSFQVLGLGSKYMYGYPY